LAKKAINYALIKAEMGVFEVKVGILSEEDFRNLSVI
jgi:hypothetical protein